MAFEGLTEKISSTFKKLRGKGRLKEGHAGYPYGIAGSRRKL